MNPKDNEIIRGAIISAFTIAAALIWKDFFTAAIERFIPPNDQLLTQFVAAAIATIAIIIALRLFLRAEETTEEVVGRASQYMKGEEQE